MIERSIEYIKYKRVNKTWIETLHREYKVVQINESSPYYKHVFKLYPRKLLDRWGIQGNMFKVEKFGNYINFYTINNTKWLDPNNGGWVQECKWYNFTLWTMLPPDVGIVRIRVNGTGEVVTFPYSHIDVDLYSTMMQNLTVEVCVSGEIFGYVGNIYAHTNFTIIKKCMNKTKYEEKETIRGHYND